MQQFVDLIPSELHHLSGAVFNAGRAAYEAPSPLYLMGLNPGGDPLTHVFETVEAHTRKVLSKARNWCEHRDEPWDEQPAGAAGMQPRVLHVLNSLGLDPGRVPSSNVVFVRSKSEADLGGDFERLAELCWPLHAAVLESLHIQTVLCFGKKAGTFVRMKVGATRLLESSVEQNQRRWSTDAYENADGLAVIVATHPSIAAWNAPETDPTALIRRVIATRKNVGHSAKLVALDVALDAPGEPTDSHQALARDFIAERPARKQPRPMQRATAAGPRFEELMRIARESGLASILVTKPPRYDEVYDYTKLGFLQPNDFRLRSIELHGLKAGGSFFRIHHSDKCPDWLPAALRSWPNVRTSASYGTNFDGDPMETAKRLAALLSSHR